MFSRRVAAGVPPPRTSTPRRAVRASRVPARTAMAADNVHVSFGQGRHGGRGLGTAVRTHRGDYAPIGRFGWDGGTGASAYADPGNGLIGILLTRVGRSVPDPARLIHDF
ncbi:serine hydrolase [Nocardiopsis composta]|uniref:CubicO group peptidase (Beta-lactamase class C family) n=1 Tax=Nocardiopsis composta TaxID=157465 RepID=A0A7W8VBK1_9ACTN|nr:serine hydrolase [Nocardiopsis composta]MBB5430212.1 CubicO group peptidase (beta-lactamase class C family) [Nocardiopsis composta]